jgi:hypothetical protein
MIKVKHPVEECNTQQEKFIDRYPQRSAGGMNYSLPMEI